MRKRFVALCVSACMFTTLFGGTMVHAADANQVTTPTQQEENGDENEKEDIPDMQEPSDPDKVETPDIIPDENDPDKEEEPEIKPEEPEAKPEEPDKNEESNKDEEVDPSLPDTESNETNIDDKDACIGIDGEPEPYEMAENMRATTIPGKWIQAADGRWWYRHDNGTYTKNGWEYISGKWYYFDGSGWMMTGWIDLGGKWYYLKISSPDSGSMLTGWQPLGGKWYYLKESSPDMGLMLTGWQYIGGEWYYFKVSSPDSGTMLTGWQPLGGKWYYLEDDGVMRTATLTQNGTTYIFESSGALNTTRLGINRQEQQNTNWCWAASSVMVGRYDTTSILTQSQIVQAVKGAIINTGGSGAEEARAIRIASGNVKTATSIERVISFNQVVSNIDNRHPFIIRMEWNSGGRHAVVCGGYSLSSNAMRVIDPAPGVTSREYNYNSMIRGTTIGSGTGRYFATVTY